MSAPPTLDPDALDAIALAEGQRELLGRLAEWGMALSKDICQRSMDSPYHPELKHDPGRAFAAASRAVRLTLAMQARVQKEIIALRNGAEPAPAPPVAERPGGLRDEAREADRESIEREVGDVDEAREARDGDRERLTEDEDFENIIAGDFDVCVEVIRAELGSLPSLQGERGGEVGIDQEIADDPDSPTPDFASLRLDPPHQGEGWPPALRSAGFQPALLL